MARSNRQQSRLLIQVPLSRRGLAGAKRSPGTKTNALNIGRIGHGRSPVSSIRR